MDFLALSGLKITGSRRATSGGPVACVPGVLLTILMTLAATTGPATAQQRIGAATAIQNQVSALRGGANVPLTQGGPVFRSETIATSGGSSARLTFLDETNLSVGPSSRVILNEFVYKGGSKAETVSINLARGAFRFATGASDKNAYKIQTSTATIGVRGTVLDISSQDGQTLVTLQDDGAAFLCVTGTNNCGTLEVRGQTFVIDPGGVRRTTAPGTRFTFQRFCSGALCGRTRLAEQPNDRPLPPQEPLRDFAQRLGDTPTGCNAGGCLPAVVESPLKWAGGATGLARSGPYTNTTAFGLELAPGQRTPLAANDRVVATVNDGPGSTAAGAVTTIIQVDPGFSYTAWGEWNGTVTVNFGEGGTQTYTRGLAVFGAITPSSVISAKTGSATYTGPVLADFAPAGGGVVQPLAIGGVANVTADFGARTVSGNLNLTMGGYAWANPIFALPINQGTIVGVTGVGFDGSLNGGASGAGKIGGVFLGPAGQEMGGDFFFTKTYGLNPGIANGIFRARQGGAPH